MPDGVSPAAWAMPLVGLLALAMPSGLRTGIMSYILLVGGPELGGLIQHTLMQPLTGKLSRDARAAFREIPPLAEDPTWEGFSDSLKMRTICCTPEEYAAFRTALEALMAHNAYAPHLGPAVHHLLSSGATYSPAEVGRFLVWALRTRETLMRPLDARHAVEIFLALAPLIAPDVFSVLIEDMCLVLEGKPLADPAPYVEIRDKVFREMWEKDEEAGFEDKLGELLGKVREMVDATVRQ